MKILYITTISNTINAFLIPHIEMLIKNGHKVDCACNVVSPINEDLLDMGVNIYNKSFSRNPININNFKAMREIKKLVVENKYDIVHVHTPNAAFYSRLALRKIKNLKIIYTAHGFHFYKGAPLFNWLIYYPLERLAAKWTDIIITINKEDLNIAKKMKLRNNGNVEMIHGVGLDEKKYIMENLDIIEYRKKLGLNENDFVILVLAELNRNKNHIQIIKAIKQISEEYPNIKVLFAGRGNLEEELKEKINKFNLQNNIKLIGYRRDVKEILKCSNSVGLFSIREGLGKCILEGMLTDNIIIATETRGPKELINNGENGFLVKVGDYKETAEKIKLIYENKELQKKFINESKKKVKMYYISNVLNELVKFYK